MQPDLAHVAERGGDDGMVRSTCGPPQAQRSL